MKLGFIGTGTITTAVIEGLIKSKAKVQQFNISQRSKKNSSYLKRKSGKVTVYSKNQEIINRHCLEGMTFPISFSPAPRDQSQGDFDLVSTALAIGHLLGQRLSELGPA